MNEFIITNPALANMAIVSLCAVVGWFLVRTITKVDKNQTKLFTWLTDVDKRLTGIEGEHKVYHQIRAGK